MTIRAGERRWWAGRGSLLLALFVCAGTPVAAQVDAADSVAAETFAVDTVLLPEDVPHPSVLPDSVAVRVEAVEAGRDAASTIILPAASPLLPPGHWAVRAAERAEAMGLAPGYLPSQRAAPRAVVYAALREAAEAERGGTSRLARGWLARFREEFPEYGRIRPRISALAFSAGAGYDGSEGVLSPAIGYFAAREEPVPVADRTGAFARVGGGVALGAAAFAAGEARLYRGELDAPRWEAAGALRGWQLSIGRAEVLYGPGRGGGITFSPREPLPRVEVQRVHPLRLSGFLRHVGRLTVHAFVSRMTDEERHPTEPWLFGARVGVQPHPRLTFALNRGAIFGGEGRPLTAKNLAGLAVGVIRSDFENQILSFDARWRLPSDALVPATVYLEWGADDGAGALDEQPAWLAGVFLPALPGVPGVGLGAEAARFANCCEHGAWYTNVSFMGNWARGEQLLGHPLGGEGWEGSAYAAADLLDGRLRLNARVFRREREDRTLVALGGGNLFSPARTGRSTGAEAEAALRVARGAEARAAWARDAGDGWREQALHLSLSAFFWVRS